jgi:hypothetical protein
MKFKLSTSGAGYEDNPEQRALVEQLGFTFRKTMPFQIGRSVEYRIEGKPEIEIGTLEELMQFVKTYGPIIVSENERIEIYDDYRE